MDNCGSYNFLGNNGSLGRPETTTKTREKNAITRRTHTAATPTVRLVDAPRPRMLLSLTCWGRRVASARVGTMAAKATPSCEYNVSRAIGGARRDVSFRADHGRSSRHFHPSPRVRVGSVRVAPTVRSVAGVATGNGPVGTTAGVVGSPSSPSDGSLFSVIENLSNDALGDAHARTKKWIVFSDLHVNRKTCDTAMEVLRTVHENAVAQDAGIIFLGDFWHARGAIPVEPLVSSLNEISKWRVPTVMIPGNHDQVTSGGETHALTPFESSNPTFVRIFTKPTLWRNALWVPYRRDAGVLKTAVSEAKSFVTMNIDTGGSMNADTSMTNNTSDMSGDMSTATSSNTHSTTLHAVMCHADVIGASMNESFQARDGISPSVFAIESDAGKSDKSDKSDTNRTGSIPTYTGHYHKPHTVPGTRITYVGSPYQVSRAEQGQRKALVVLDADNAWVGGEVVGSENFKSEGENVSTGNKAVTDTAITNSLIPLDIGPRHFSVTGEDGCIPPEARAGDFVRWTLPLSSAVDVGVSSSKKEKKKSENENTSKASDAITAARASGIEIEITYEAIASPPRIPKAEEMGPNGLYDAYCAAANLPQEVSKFGKEILQQVALNVAKKADADGTSLDSLQMTQRSGVNLHVSLHSVEVTGFGAFVESTYYPLKSRGVCVVVGDNSDDRCSDSNGAGKTTLVMSAMWALTGKSDQRIEQGSSKTLTKTDVVSDGAKTASVKVEGTVNGDSFWIERTVSRTKVVSLKYFKNGEDKTLVDSRLTQAAINRDIGADVIGRVAFHGQHTVGSLLDANDNALKHALGELVEAETWELAKDFSRKKVSDARKKVAASSADLSAREAYLGRATERLRAAIHQRDQWDVQEKQRSDALKQAVAAVEVDCQVFAEKVVSARDRLTSVNCAWDLEEQAALTEAEETERLMWEQQDSSNLVNSQTIQGTGDAPMESEQYFIERGATLESDAERLRKGAQEKRSAEASARAVAAAAHAAVGAFKGIGSAGNMDSGCADASHDGSSSDSSKSMGTCVTCLQPIDPDAHKNALEKLVAKAEETRLVHVASAGELNLADFEVQKAMQAIKENTSKANQFRERNRLQNERVSKAARDSGSRLNAIKNLRVNPVVVASVLTRLETFLNSVSGDGNQAVNNPLPTQPMLDSDGGADAVRFAETLVSGAERALRALEERRRDANDIRKIDSRMTQQNPHTMEVESLQQQVDSETADLNLKRLEAEQSELELNTFKRGDVAFGQKGIQSYLFEGALGELSERTGVYMESLTGGAITMELKISGTSAVSPKKKKTADADTNDEDAEDTDLNDSLASGASAEKIERVIHAHLGDGSRVGRSLRQLSGGERRRCALALALAHADLSMSRGGVTCDLLVLDEVLQHLDSEGIARVAVALRSLEKNTVLLTSQADSTTAHLFDTVDRVFKQGGSSGVALAEEIQSVGESVEA